ncbi:MAG: phosphoribosylamine--glycine ligase [Deltaproteobacteria bacterium]|nr:MAG: phosphoribosylamine--glycine ligase [Deltaproteobacteria bacterium]
MRVMLIGQGGREHALAWKLAASPAVENIFCVPGNDGMAQEPKVQCLDISYEDASSVLEAARGKGVDLVVTGPEKPLVDGLADFLGKEGITALGPGAEGARLEGSKVYAKRFMKKYGIPTADFEVFEDPRQAAEYVEKVGGTCVIKADGLAAGKGVLPCDNVEQAKQAIERIMVAREFGSAGSRIVIEEYLEGEEASFIALCDGKTIVPLASSQDHKRVFDGDKGPNTGGMGAYSPAPVLDDDTHQLVVEKIMGPLLEGLRQEGIKYRGIIYAGLMVTAEGPKVLEFNVRMGDPETQPLMMRLSSDLAQLLHACATGSLDGTSVSWDPRPCVCVVLSSAGYPGKYEKGQDIYGLDEVAGMPGVKVFHAGTKKRGDRFVTNGGRVLNVCAMGSGIEQARNAAYSAIERIRFEAMHYRKDIASRAIGR